MGSSGLAKKVKNYHADRRRNVGRPRRGGRIVFETERATVEPTLKYMTMMIHVYIHIGRNIIRRPDKEINVNEQCRGRLLSYILVQISESGTLVPSFIA
jgi:hypothetical protein